MAWAIDSTIVVLILTPLYTLFWGFLLIGPFEPQTRSEGALNSLTERCFDQNMNYIDCSPYQLSGTKLLLISLISLAMILVSIALYYGLTMRRTGRHNGQSMGKQLVGIKVIHEDGTPVDFVSACYRQVLVIYLLVNSLLSFLTLGLFLFINYLYPVWDKNNQALHDKVVHTRVIRL
jgi:uncharacterized RDD family membrane protein YckC